MGLFAKSAVGMRSMCSMALSVGVFVGSAGIISDIADSQQ